MTVGDDGTVAGLEELPRPYRTMLEQALVAQQIPLPDWMPELNQGRGTLLGAAGTPEAIRLLSPVGTAVEEPQPVFRWTTVPGAEYQVTDRWKVGLLHPGATRLSRITANVTTWPGCAPGRRPW